MKLTKLISIQVILLLSTTVFAQIEVGFTADTTTTCDNVPIIFTDTTVIPDGLCNNITWEWSFDDGSPISNLQNPEHTYTAPNVYTVRLKIFCDDSLLDDCTRANYITVNDIPTTNILVDRNVYNGAYSLFFDCNFPDTYTYNYKWDFGDNSTATSKKILHTYSHESSYNIELIVNAGKQCRDTTDTTVTVTDTFTFPDIFTPNGDCKNDVFFIKTNGYTIYKFTVMNRWGQVVYTVTAKNITWDGRNTSGLRVPAGTYYYFIKAESGEEQYSKKGYLLLIR
ncbi:MAG: gliding motility-associated C-terminal domain-containing protein [Bacteroidia bacterium]|nr:gliding motility-associated C-terminal domain-containing protein [Bacteroidia bacterium]